MQMRDVKKAEAEKCRTLVSICFFVLLISMFLLEFAWIPFVYVAAQLTALGCIIWAGKILGWGPARILGYLVIGVIPVGNWLTLAGIHRALRKAAQGPPTEAKGHSYLKGIGMACAIIVGLVAMAVVIENAGSPSSQSTQSPQRSNRPSNVKLEDVILKELEVVIADRKGEIFAMIHPSGRATGSRVHDVKIIQWKNDVATNQWTDVVRLEYRYTIYWEGPVTKDGYTKIEEVFDAEVGRSVSGTILATNGITNRETAEVVGFVAGTLLRNALSD